jgi:hypothetical protein
MPKQPDDEARKSKQLIDGWLGTKVSSFCYPYYISHGYLADAVQNAGYEQARGGARTSYYILPDDDSLDRFNVDCRQISKNEKVGGWVRSAYWHVLTFHGIGDEQDGWEPITVAEFARQVAELANHRDSGGAFTACQYPRISRPLISTFFLLMSSLACHHIYQGMTSLTAPAFKK